MELHTPSEAFSMGCSLAIVIAVALLLLAVCAGVMYLR